MDALKRFADPFFLTIVYFLGAYFYPFNSTEQEIIAKVLSAIFLSIITWVVESYLFLKIIYEPYWIRRPGPEIPISQVNPIVLNRANLLDEGHGVLRIKIETESGLGEFWFKRIIRKCRIIIHFDGSFIRLLPQWNYRQTEIAKNGCQLSHLREKKQTTIYKFLLAPSGEDILKSSGQIIFDLKCESKSRLIRFFSRVYKRKMKKLLYPINIAIIE